MIYLLDGGMMKINNNNLNIEQAIQFADYDKYLLKHINNTLLLSDFQMAILKKNGFNVNDYGSMNQLLFDIEKYLNVEYDDELELISSQLAELIYYKDTKK